jgi:hypothetical protein
MYIQMIFQRIGLNPTETRFDVDKPNLWDRHATLADWRSPALRPVAESCRHPVTLALS